MSIIQQPTLHTVDTNVAQKFILRVKLHKVLCLVLMDLPTRYYTKHKLCLQHLTTSKVCIPYNDVCCYLYSIVLCYAKLKFCSGYNDFLCILLLCCISCTYDKNCNILLILSLAFQVSLHCCWSWCIAMGFIIGCTSGDSFNIFLKF